MGLTDMGEAIGHLDLPTMRALKTHDPRVTCNAAGMEAMQAVGIDIPPYMTFNSLEDAETFARKSDRAWVFKPMGDEDDKSLTDVSKGRPISSAG